MSRRKAKRIIGFILMLVMLLSSLGMAPLAAPAAPKSGTVADSASTYSTKTEYVSERIANNYSKVSAAYALKPYAGENVVISLADAADEASAAMVSADVRGFRGADKVLSLVYGDVVNLKIDVPADGLYYVLFDYLSYDESVLPIQMGLKVDGEYPFYESRNLRFETTWKQNEEPSYDRYGNELVTIPNKMIQWESKYMMDSSYRHSGPLMLQLTKGEHEIELQVKEGTFLLGNMTLTAPKDAPFYTGSQAATGSNLIQLQGEKFTTSNDSSIHAVVEYDASLDPYEVSDTVLNTLDSDSFDAGGQMISYEFTVEEPGNYMIAMNYRQSDKTDFPVFFDVRVDGVIPNDAFVAYPMAYSTNYQTTTLVDPDGKPLTVTLDKGTHTVSFTISIDPLRDALEALDEIMSGINDLALEITKVAGTNADKYRDLKLSRYIPDIEDQLYGYANRLKMIESSYLKYSNSRKNVAVMSSMLIAAEQLISLAKKPDEIPFRVSELSSSTNSANHYLATTIDSLVRNNIAIDRVYVYQEGATLPARPNIFQDLWMNIRRFVASFTEQAYSASNTNPEHLQVWVNRSSQYVQIMQKMIDEYFTPETGIDVDISIMPDQYKLVLANSSGSAPDVATGINYTIPYELAVRGALADMTQFADFQEVAKPYEPGFFLTGTIGDAVYSMPETMNFWVLFYRTDVLDKLGLETPDTITDVIDMLPELQMRGLNFYYATAGMLSMRNFHGTTPLIVQNGGSLYFGDASQGTALGTEASVTGFTALTDLFTIYNMPVNIDNFYQHFRNGDLPIGIADIGVYNLLKNAAPELEGSWAIKLIPGTEQPDGTIDRSTCGCAESCVIFKSNADREAKAWEFIRWWSSTETQARFGQTLQITYGDEYIWSTANIDAFDLLPWDSSDKEIIKQFSKNVVDVARVPGTYLLEREVSNAFNDIVVNGDNEQTRIDTAVKTINREFTRKLEEFGYTDSEGRVLREYRIPTIESISKLLGRSTDGKE